MAKPAPLEMCGMRHAWAADFSDGDTCYCGAFYLFRSSNGFAYQLEPAPIATGLNPALTAAAVPLLVELTRLARAAADHVEAEVKR